MRISVYSENALVLRDGRPFGSMGSVQSTGQGFNWPMPQTVAGMIRSAIGLSVSPDYFTPETRAVLQKVVVRNQMIYGKKQSSEKAEALYPLPLDCIFTDCGNDLIMHTLDYRPDNTALSEGEGTDIPYAPWITPLLDTSEKPSKRAPVYVWESFMRSYIDGNHDCTSVSAQEIGISAPVWQSTMHNSVDFKSGVSKDGKLFAHKEIFMGAKAGEQIIPLSIHMTVENIPPEAAETFTAENVKNMYLGGERRMVAASFITEEDCSAMPASFGNKQYLKLVLISHGNFGGWVPAWLDPAETGFKTIAGIPCGVRLVSACVGSWFGISGWEYQGHSHGIPKAMQKIVPAGSVYVIEIEKPELSADVAAFFWGKSMDPDSVCNADGYSTVIVANI